MVMATVIPSNECELALGQIAEICEGSLSRADPSRLARGVSTDTRTLRPGALFVALRGERMDGHDYVRAAFERGAAAALVGRDAPEIDGPCVRVDDTLVALGQLARAALRRARAERALPVLAIGGAAGKTTTKELAARAAAALFGSALATRGNLNNLIGVPMTLLSLAPEHRAAVIEVGTNAPGEIARLGQIVEPDVALVLNVDNEHTERLETLEAVADEEGALFASLRAAKRSTAVANLEEPYSLGQIRRAPTEARRLTFGEGADADVRLLSRAPTRDGRSALSLRVGPALTASRRSMDVGLSLGLLGPGPAIDAAAALAATLSMLGRPAREDEVLGAAKAMELVEPVAGRLVPRALPGGPLVLDDTYNANPRSVRASVEAARELAALRGGALHVLLGDMLELGELGPSLHAEVCSFIGERAPASFAGVGALMAEALRARGGERERAFELPEQAARWARARVGPTDVVLVKGSRGLTMERAVAALVVDEGQGS
jgi:UDP-N-acetylmuramoyl-tripeptide--D-alanyl-D-alanine ligase